MERKQFLTSFRDSNHIVLELSLGSEVLRRTELFFTQSQQVLTKIQEDLTKIEEGTTTIEQMLRLLETFKKEVVEIFKTLKGEDRLFSFVTINR